MASPCAHWTASAQGPRAHDGRPWREMLTTSTPIWTACSQTRVPTKPLPPNTRIFGADGGAPSCWSPGLARTAVPLQFKKGVRVKHEFVYYLGEMRLGGLLHQLKMHPHPCKSFWETNEWGIARKQVLAWLDPTAGRTHCRLASAHILLPYPIYDLPCKEFPVTCAVRSSGFCGVGHVRGFFLGA